MKRRTSPQFRDAAARDVPRAEHEVGLVRGGDQPGDVGRVVGEVAVHLQHEVGAAARARAGSRRGRPARGPPCAPGAGRRPRAALPRAGRRSRRSRRASRRRSRAPGPSGAEHLAERAHHRLEVLALVVGGQADRSRARGRLIGVVANAWRRRCRATPRSPSSSTCSPTCSSSRARTRSGCSPTGAPPRACARRGGRSRSSRSTAARRSCPGSARRSRRRSSRSSRTARSTRCRSARSAIPAEVVVFMRLPGLGPKTARRIWKELGVTTLDELKQAAEAEQLRTLDRPGREDRGEHPQARSRRRARRIEPQRRCSGTRCRRCSRSSRCCASTRPPTRSPRRAARAAGARRCATSTSSPPPPTRPR